MGRYNYTITVNSVLQEVMRKKLNELNLTTDFIALLRGNLASVEFRQNKKDRVIRLLRSEIEHYRGRGEEHPRLLPGKPSLSELPHHAPRAG